MKILQINKFYFERGGTEQYMFMLSRLLEAHGHTVVPFAMQHPQNRPTPWSRFFPSFVPTEQMEISFRGMKTVGRMFYSFEAQRKLEQLLEVFRPDVAHVHNIYHQLSPSILRTLKKHTIPVVMTVHDTSLVSPSNVLYPGDNVKAQHTLRTYAQMIKNGAMKRSRIASLLVVGASALHRRLRLYEKNVDHFIAPSEFVKQCLIEAGYARDRITVIPHVVDMTPPSSLPHERKGFLYVGRLSPEKGVDVLLQAFRALPHLSLTIAGSGPLESEYRKSVRDSGMENITFLGSVSREAVSHALSSAQALIVPSRVHETFGLVALEAMIHRTPVIASRVGALPELVHDHVNGLLVEPGDAYSLQQAIEGIARTPSAVSRMGEQAFAHASLFTPKTHVESILRLYTYAMARV